jgi:hypothetical protein
MSCISPGFVRQIMSILLIVCYIGSLVTRTVVSLTAAKFKPYIFCAWLRLVLCCKLVHSQEFVWLLKISGGKSRPAYKAHNLIAIYERVSRDRQVDRGTILGRSRRHMRKLDVKIMQIHL